MLLLLIEDKQTGILKRCEDRRACADHDTRLAARNAPPLVIAFAHTQTRMEHSNGFSKVRGHFMQQLWRERNLRHEQHGGAALIQRALNQCKID